MIHKFVGSAGLAVAAFAGVLSSASPAYAFCRSTTCELALHPAACVRDANGCWAAGMPLFWASGCAGYSVQRDGSAKLGLDFATAESLVISAFARWPAASCADGFPSISVSELAPASCDRAEYHPNGPNANIVMFHDTDWPYDPLALALTTVTFAASSGEILDADLEIDSANYTFDTESLSYTLTHEAGHFLGLDHSLQTDAIMYARYMPIGTPPPTPTLSLDDSAAICAAYPPGGTLACQFAQPKGFAPDCGGDVTSGCSVGQGAASAPGATALCALGLGALLIARRRRQAAGYPSG